MAFSILSDLKKSSISSSHLFLGLPTAFSVLYFMNEFRVPSSCFRNPSFFRNAILIASLHFIHSLVSFDPALDFNPVFFNFSCVNFFVSATMKEMSLSCSRSAFKLFPSSISSSMFSIVFFLFFIIFLIFLFPNLVFSFRLCDESEHFALRSFVFF